MQGIEVIGPYLGGRSFATRAYDHQGGEQTSTATDGDGPWTFRADGAEVKLTISEGGSLRLPNGSVPMTAARVGPGMRLALSRR